MSIDTLEKLYIQRLKDKLWELIKSHASRNVFRVYSRAFKITILYQHVILDGRIYITITDRDTDELLLKAVFYAPNGDIIISKIMEESIGKQYSISTQKQLVLFDSIRNTLDILGHKLKPIFDEVTDPERGISSRDYLALIYGKK